MNPKLQTWMSPKKNLVMEMWKSHNERRKPHNERRNSHNEKRKSQSEKRKSQSEKRKSLSDRGCYSKVWNFSNMTIWLGLTRS
jgi:hypothetical protein